MDGSGPGLRIPESEFDSRQRYGCKMKKKRCYTCGGSGEIKSSECQAKADAGILEAFCMHDPVICPDCEGTGVRGRHKLLAINMRSR